MDNFLFHLQFVAIAFWGIYAVDRELIYPARLDEHIPAILNHFWVRVAVMEGCIVIFTEKNFATNSIACESYEDS